MYKLNSAILKLKSQDGRWEATDVSNHRLADLFKNYSAILLTLSHPLYTNKLGLDLYKLYATLNNESMTVEQWLVANGNKTLPTVDRPYELRTRYAKFMDAFRAGYKVTPVNPKTATDADLDKADKKWLYLNRPKTDMAKFGKHCMVSVNGYWHYMEGSKDGAWVRDGMVSCIHANLNEIGILNFADVSELHYHPITKEMIYRHLPNEPLGNRACIDLGIDVTNKTIALVLGGYLHILDAKSFYRIGTEQVMIDFRNIPLMERYYESRKYLNLSGLGLQVSSVNDSQISVAELFSDEVITRYLTMSQSFILILDNTDIYLDKEVMKVGKVMNLGITYAKPDLPLFTGFGRNVIYWSRHEQKQWAIMCPSLFTQTRQFATRPNKGLLSVADSRLTTRIVEVREPHFLKIATDV